MAEDTGLGSLGPLRRLGMAPAGAHQNADGTWDWDQQMQTTGTPSDRPEAVPATGMLDRGGPLMPTTPPVDANSMLTRGTPEANGGGVSGLGMQTRGTPEANGGMGMLTRGTPADVPAGGAAPQGLPASGGPMGPPMAPPSQPPGQPPGMGAGMGAGMGMGRHRRPGGPGGGMRPSFQALHQLAGGFGQGGY